MSSKFGDTKESATPFIGVLCRNSLTVPKPCTSNRVQRIFRISLVISLGQINTRDLTPHTPTSASCSQSTVACRQREKCRDTHDRRDRYTHAWHGRESGQEIDLVWPISVAESKLGATPEDGQKAASVLSSPCPAVCFYRSAQVRHRVHTWSLFGGLELKDY